FISIDCGIAQGQPPKFDLYLGPDHWDTVDFTVSMDHEIIHLASTDYIYVCLVNIGLGNPFISALELRILDSNMYGNRLESMVLSARTNFGTSETLRDKPAV
ncbi:leucine-rich repeat transmembrane protein kinase protein, partial [Tanacetum coccineum]